VLSLVKCGEMLHKRGNGSAHFGDWTGLIPSGSFTGCNSKPFFGGGRSRKRRRFDGQIERFCDYGCAEESAMDTELLQRGYFLNLCCTWIGSFGLRQVYFVQWRCRIEDVHGLGRRHNWNSRRHRRHG
jgi:hypothetical protein